MTADRRAADAQRLSGPGRRRRAASCSIRTAAPPRIGRDGTMTQGNRQVGAIGLFTIDNQAKLTRYENSGVIPDRAATPVVDFTRTGMQQGFIENANVNPVMEMTRLINITRAFEMVSSSLAASETSLAGSHQDARSGRVSKPQHGFDRLVHLSTHWIAWSPRRRTCPRCGSVAWSQRLRRHSAEFRVCPRSSSSASASSCTPEASRSSAKSCASTRQASPSSRSTPVMRAGLGTVARRRGFITVSPHPTLERPHRQRTGRAHRRRSARCCRANAPS